MVAFLTGPAGATALKSAELVPETDRVPVIVQHHNMVERTARETQLKKSYAIHITVQVCELIYLKLERSH